MKNNHLRIGTAGWNLPAPVRGLFPEGNSLLERYSQVFNAVEINSSFYKSHKRTTYERWAAATPPHFRFAVKMPKQITHTQRLNAIENDLDNFIQEISGLQIKLGPLLIQLPPSLKFDPKLAKSFFELLQKSFNGKVVIEPRHTSWAHSDAISLLHAYNISRVIADPVKVPLESNKQLFNYYRLHGSPEVYSSSYNTPFLDQLAQRLDDSSWVIFDNTKLGAATQNALDLKQMSSLP